MSAFVSQFGDMLPAGGTPVIWGESLAYTPAGAPPLDGIKTVSPA